MMPHMNRMIPAAAAVAGLLTAGVGHADVVDFVITLDGGQQVPPVDTPATGSGTLTLDTDTNEFSWDFEYTGLLGTETAAHFHGNAPLCANAGVQIGLSLGSPKVGSAKLTDEQAGAVMNGLWYANVHTDKHPAGEIRGQVLPAPIDNPVGSIDMGDIHVQLEPVADGLVAPNWGATAPGHSDRLFVTDQPGRLWSIDVASGETHLFLDATDMVVDMGAFGPGSFDERGMLGVAFHPDFMSNGLFYTYTSEPEDGSADYSTMPPDADPNHQSVIREWTVDDPSDPDTVVDPGSSRELLRVDEPQFNHDGGGLGFGADGMLYISLGDGGSADDQGVGHVCIGNAQDTSSPLGTVLRIDPQGDDGPNGEYGIPKDNPFVGKAGFLDEIWAYGLRNPWRFSFDTETGDMWLADVGQNDLEEINVMEAGGNYGWAHKEGSFTFIMNGHQNGYITDMSIEPASGVEGPFIDPVVEYHNPTDGIAAIGGFVYRGDRIAELRGRYVFGEWSQGDSGRIFYIDEEGEIAEFELIGQDEVGLFVHGFGQDADGELYVMGNTTGVPFEETGVVMRIEPLLGDLNNDGEVGGADLGTLLSEWGPCADPDDCPADLDGNGAVDGADLGTLLSNWTS